MQMDKETEKKLNTMIKEISNKAVTEYKEAIIEECYERIDLFKCAMANLEYWKGKQDAMYEIVDFLKDDFDVKKDRLEVRESSRNGK